MSRQPTEAKISAEAEALNYLNENLKPNSVELKKEVEDRSRQSERNLFGEHAISNSLYNRGNSFINAAIKMIENQYQAPQGLEGEQLKKWIEEKTKNALARLAIIKNEWDKNPNAKHNDNLGALVDILCIEVNNQLYKGKKDKHDIISELANAENHANWKKRKEERSIIKMNDDTYQVRVDRPLIRFTKDQEKEWEKILDPKKPPKWFSKLPPWERNELSSRVRAWQEAKKSNPNLNLGEHMGVPPTTIRGYPGARNASQSYFYTFTRDKETGTFKLTAEAYKIRSGHMSPSKMKNPDERYNNAKENLKQLILEGVRAKVEAGQVDIFVDFQTLITPPFKPEDNEMDKDRLRAITELRGQFQTEAGFKDFLVVNGVKVPPNHNPKIEILTSNYPVNWGLRQVSNFFGPIAVPFQMAFAHLTNLKPLLKNPSIKNFAAWLFSPLIELGYAVLRAFHNTSTLSSLKARLNTNNPTPEQQMAKAALDKIDAISGPLQRIRNFAYKGINHNAERAALEQIAVSGLGGVRIGSCMSGKDREGAVSQIVAAMTAFYGVHGKFPPIPPKDNMKDPEIQKQRLEFEKMVAEQFLSGHDQRIAEANAQGCSGLKNPSDVLGTRITKQAETLLNARHPEWQPERTITAGTEMGNKTRNEFYLSPAKLSHKVAGLNRMEDLKTDAKQRNYLRKTLESTVNSTMEHAVKKNNVSSNTFTPSAPLKENEGLSASVQSVSPLPAVASKPEAEKIKTTTPSNR